MRYKFYIHRSIVVPTLSWKGTSYEQNADLLSLRDSISFLHGVKGSIVSLSSELLPAVRLNLPISEKKILMAAASHVSFEGSNRGTVPFILNDLVTTKEGTGRLMFRDSWILFHKPTTPYNFIRIEVEADTQEDFIELPIFEIKLRATRL